MKGIAVLRFVSMIPSLGIPFFRYLINSEITERNGMIILRPDNNSDISADELKRVTTLVTLRRLNLIKHLEMFLSSLVHILPPDTNFIGCFSAERARSGIPENEGMIIRLLDSILHRERRECHILSSNKVTEILERNGLQIINMTKMNGLTCFHSRKIAGHSGLEV